MLSCAWNVMLPQRVSSMNVTLSSVESMIATRMSGAAVSSARQ
jgi:hypothetical protein